MGWCWPNGSPSIPQIAEPWGHFGTRPIGKGFHDGTDFIGFGLNRSIGPGRVTALWKWDGRPAALTRTQMGNAVIIDHGNGIESRTAHNAMFLVKLGQDLNGGEPIGVLGQTGFTTGPHNHTEIRVHGLLVDPEKFLPGMIAAAAGMDSLPFDQTASTLGAPVEVILIREKTGTAFRFRAGHAYAFPTEANYNAVRNQQAAYAKAGATDVMALPELVRVPKVADSSLLFWASYVGAPKPVDPAGVPYS